MAEQLFLSLIHIYMSAERKKRLENICHLRRIELIEMLYKFQTGHPGGSLSSVEIISVLYFEIMNTKRIINNEKNRDRFILSKGHSAPILYLTLVDLGFFHESELNTFRQIDSILQGHPSAGKTPGVEISTGPLGLGLSAGVGISPVSYTHLCGAGADTEAIRQGRGDETWR